MFKKQALSWLLWSTVFCTVMSVVIAPFAMAAPKRKAKKSGDLSVAMLPIQGGNASELHDAIELELELINGIAVQNESDLATELGNPRGGILESAVAAPVMQMKKLDILIHTFKLPTKEGDTWIVLFYAQDGKPRVYKEFSADQSVDETAVSVGKALKPVVNGWAKRPPIKVKLPTPSTSTRRSQYKNDDSSRSVSSSKSSKKQSRTGFGDLKRDGQIEDDENMQVDDEENEYTRTDENNDEQFEVEQDFDLQDPRRPHKFSFDLSLRWGVSAWNFNQQIDQKPRVNPLLLSGDVYADWWPWKNFGFDGSFTMGAAPWKFTSTQTSSTTTTTPTNPSTPGPTTPTTIDVVLPEKFVATYMNLGLAFKMRYLFTEGPQGVGLGIRVGYRYWGG
jgi:hypothetical protein